MAAELDYLVIGHVTVDRLPNDRFVQGGTATYASLTALRLGAKVGLHTSASYEPGLVDLLRGVRVARIPAELTTQFVNVYEGDQRRQRIEAVAERLTFAQIPAEWRGTPIVHLAPVANEVDPELVNCFPGSFVGVTPQGWMRQWDAEGNVSAVPLPHPELVLPRATAVVFSDADLPDKALLPEYVRLARTLVVTQGAGGAMVYHGGAARRSLAFRPASETDPTGAGDVFAAAYFLQFYKTGDPFGSADWANCVASFAVEKPGPAGVPRLEAVEERWRKGSRIHD